jgi:HlyD family secretion protein
MMLIVPNSDKLDAEIRIAPHDIDQVRIGQNARLRFTAFSQRATPEIAGQVNRVSADTTLDQRTGQNYFTVRVTLAAEEVGRLGNVRIVPGMPVEAFVMTSQRKVLSYLTKPLHDQVYRAFRER